MGRIQWRIGPQLLAIAALLSLLMVATAITAWVMSFWATDVWKKQTRETVTSDQLIVTSTRIVSGEGSLIFSQTELQMDLSNPEMKALSEGLLSAGWQHQRFGVESTSGAHLGSPDWLARSAKPFNVSSTQYQSGLQLPWWAVAAAGIPVPVGWYICHLRKRRREQQRKSGQCAACGYDLRASPGRCPECGLDREENGSPVALQCINRPRP